MHQPEIDRARMHGLKNPPKISDLPWFVAQLKPNGFAKAKANLERQGFATFMPMQARMVRHARKDRKVRRPVFPGYIFVSFDPAVTQWRVINNTFGVKTLVSGNSMSPQQAPHGLMTALFAGCDHEENILPPPVFHEGAKVRVVNGPFKNVLAEVAQTSENERVRLLFDLMGRSVVAECAGAELEILPT